MSALLAVDGLACHLCGAQGFRVLNPASTDLMHAQADFAAFLGHAVGLRAVSHDSQRRFASMECKHKGLQIRVEGNDTAPLITQINGVLVGVVEVQLISRQVQPGNHSKLLSLSSRQETLLLLIQLSFRDNIEVIDLLLAVRTTYI